MPATPGSTAAPVIHPDVADYLLKIVHDPVKHGVPELHFRFWNQGPEPAKRWYVSSFETDPERKAWYQEGWLCPEYDFEALGQLPPESLGYQYREHIRKNGLDHRPLLNYRLLQQHKEVSGHLAGMPPEIKFATIRGFQAHDILHPLTGYDTSPLGEIALQAFNLAQMRMPYAGFWMSIVTTQMAFLMPQAIDPLMDAIARGWQHGRRAKNLTYTKWEQQFERPVEELRQEYELV